MDLTSLREMASRTRIAPSCEFATQDAAPCTTPRKRVRMLKTSCICYHFRLYSFSSFLSDFIFSFLFSFDLTSLSHFISFSSLSFFLFFVGKWFFPFSYLTYEWRKRFYYIYFTLRCDKKIFTVVSLPRLQINRSIQESNTSLSTNYTIKCDLHVCWIYSRKRDVGNI